MEILHARTPGPRRMPQVIRFVGRAGPGAGRVVITPPAGDGLWGTEICGVLW